MNIKTSPIFYQGCKKKAINQGLIDLFPQQIDTFYDLFGGSGIVSMNTKAERYVLNDINTNLYNLYKMFKDNSADDIISKINRNIEKFNLEFGNNNKISFDNRSKNYNKTLAEIHKQNYKEFVIHYKYKHTAINLYTLLIYCFCHQIRTNSKGEFNMPCGNGTFTDDNKLWIKQGCEFFSNDKLSLHNKSYTYFMDRDFNSNDFIYIDSPYYDTTATYNENGGWTREDEILLYSHLERLNAKGLKFGLSNTFNCKGKANTMLQEWCELNKWNVNHLEVNYSAMGKGNSENDEVYICNYDTSKQLSIFDL